MVTNHLDHKTSDTSCYGREAERESSSRTHKATNREQSKDVVSHGWARGLARVVETAASNKISRDKAIEQGTTRVKAIEEHASRTE